MTTPAARPDRTLLVIVSIIAAVVIFALVVVFTRGAPAQLDPTTPEGAVQAYTTAVLDGDSDAALELLTRDIRDTCDRVEPAPTMNLRLTLLSTKVTGDRAVVRVSITEDYGNGPFGGSSYQSDDTFVLRQDGGAWLVDGAPWQLIICSNSGIKE